MNTLEPMFQFSQPFHEIISQKIVKMKYEKESFLFLDGDTIENLYFIYSGKVKISKTTLEGKQLTLYVAQQHELISELHPFQGKSKHISSAEVIENGVIGVISVADFEKLLMTHSFMVVEFMKWMGLVFRRNQSKFRDLVLNGKHAALYSTLIRLTNSYGKPVKDGILIDLSLSNREMGEFIGTTRESVNRILNELKSLNVISMGNGYITVHDIDYLRNENQCDTCPVDICKI